MREKRRYSFSFWRTQGREKRRKRKKGEKRRKGEEAKPSSTRRKGLISRDYGCMWFYAMGSMYE